MGKYLESNIYIPSFIQLYIHKLVTIFLLIFDHDGYITMAKGYFLHKRILIDFFKTKIVFMCQSYIKLITPWK